jgi:hypothetical protein
LNDTRSFKKSKKQNDEMAKKKGVCFASANKLVSQLSVSKFSETPFDSLDINRKSQILNDDLDCDNLSLSIIIIKLYSKVPYIYNFYLKSW